MIPRAERQRREIESASSVKIHKENERELRKNARRKFASFVVLFVMRLNFDKK